VRLPGPGHGAPLFVLERVGVVAGGTRLLDDVSATIPARLLTAVVGPSGAGKSTLLRLLNRLVEPTTGQIILDGRPLPSWDVLALRRRVGLVAQQPVLLGERVLDELRVGRPDLTGAHASDLLAVAGLPDHFLDRRTAELSGGEAQRVCLARQLAVEPEVLALDEPTAALDPASVAAIERSLGQLLAGGHTVVMVSHDPAQVRRLAGHVLALRGGRLVEEGPPAALRHLDVEVQT
jgi:putative ABC transport system ATP-binding protein